MFLVSMADKLPYSIRILLESAIRNCDNFQVTKDDVEKIIDWENTSPKQVEIPFKPARVLLQVCHNLQKVGTVFTVILLCVLICIFCFRILLEYQLLLISLLCVMPWANSAVIPTRSILWCVSSFSCYLL